MQTKIFLPLLSATVILAGGPSASAAPDNEAQARMREALRQKMLELNQPAAAPAVAPSAPAFTPVPVAPAPAPKPAPVVTPQPTVVVPVPVATTPAPVAVPTYTAPSRTVFSDVEATPNSDADRLVEALRAKQAILPAPAPVAPAPAVSRPIFAAPKPAPVVIPLTANMEAPATPFSGTKQARLADLLARYRADQITPQEYHSQRAAIISEP